MLSVFFIKRPIFAMVISLLIVLGGAVSIVILPVQEYPDVAPPTVKVSATYVGANAYTVDETVTRYRIRECIAGDQKLLSKRNQSKAW